MILKKPHQKTRGEQGIKEDEKDAGIIVNYQSFKLINYFRMHKADTEDKDLLN